MIEPVVLIGQKDAPLKLRRVKPVVDNGDLGRGVGRQRIDGRAVCLEDAVLRLRGGGNVVYVGQLPAPAVFVADLPNTVGIDALDRYAVLNRARHLHFHALTSIGSNKGFNQSLLAPFC